ncbi:MAG: hypothetical protein JW910_17835 [Anaerolineae bacterium]|nr:hypothetical protein [Anaerolineae bacterium]
MHNVGKPRVRERGQGLAEYGLILVLVGVVVILVVGLFGEQVKKSYCKVVFSIAPEAEAPGCNGLDVTCSVQTSSPFRLQAIVTDNAGEDNISEVNFYVDGNLYNTEYHYMYCLEGGDGPQCSAYDGSGGNHTFSAVAYDDDGNVGRCSLSYNVP